MEIETDCVCTFCLVQTETLKAITSFQSQAFVEMQSQFQRWLLEQYFNSRKSGLLLLNFAVQPGAGSMPNCPVFSWTYSGKSCYLPP